ncbi:MAG: primosomal protein N' [Oscillospiraceae bacterium]|nr:primosomal protein N' [Oscillospiraceae bacterium]
MKDSFIAKIGVENCAYSFDELFSFIIPESLADEVVVGRRVLVPFGKSNSVRQGFVFSVNTASQADDVSELKSVISPLDSEPLLSEEMIRLALFIRDRVFCTYFAAAKAMLPGGMCSKKPVNELSVKMVRLTDKAIMNDASSLTVKQKNIYDFLKEFETASVKELVYYTGCTPAVIKTMEKNGICEVFDVPVSRSPIRNISPGNFTPPELSVQQKEAFAKLYNAYLSDKSETALLFGVTGSGKTNVYLSLIDRILGDGKNVIVLVPEISLTSQTISLFERRFGKSIAVLHSGLSAGERRDEFYRIKHKNARVVIGTRSAVFAPIENIGAIIIDEEQEHTYKSEMSPRYDAKTVAKFRCAYNNALLVLASATPSIETYAKAESGKYVLCELTERYGKAVLPDVITVDMTDKNNTDRYSAICNPLAQELENNLNNKKQSILLVNRRGYNTFVVCEECKNVVSCPKCSISLTYHSANNRLMCHYCGHSEEFTDVCPKCSHKNIRYSGFGTQRVEQELHSRFKNARILRMDADTTSAKNSHEKALSAFSAGEYDILIGTQMVAKGLDFPNVTLVGIISADNELYCDDFRSAERTFDLITQVTGRAGRGDTAGKAYIQTVSPDNEILSIASKQDYKSFYKNEIIIRKALVYPPFCDICVVGFSSGSEAAAFTAANEFFKIMLNANSDEKYGLRFIVLGPIEPKISKLNNQFRQKIIIKCVNTSLFRELISETLKIITQKKEFKNTYIYAVINPENTE